MNDSDIMRLIRRSPSEGHRALFDEYYNYVYAIVLNTLRNVGTKEDIEDCVIDSFADILINVDTSTEGSLKAFIGTVAKNKSISAYRSLRRKSSGSTSFDDEELGNIPSGEDVAASAENSAAAEQLIEHIRQLGKPDSDILIHKYFYERNSREIAAMTGLSPAAVRIRCSRALKRLREKLAGDYSVKESV